MNFTGKNRHQGDVQIFEITEVPRNAKKIEKQFIAASERSGSFHALFGDYDLYEVEDGFVANVMSDEGAILNHSLASILANSGISMSEAKVLEKKDHRHTIVPKGVHFFSIQKRFDPLKAFKESVKD